MHVCAVCLSAIRTQGARTTLDKCGHVFHTRCIRAWLARGMLTCPVCRTTCMAHVITVRGGLEKKIQAIARTVPDDGYFPTHILGLITAPTVQRALDITDDALQYLIDLAYDAVTPAAFFAAIRDDFTEKKAVRTE